MASVARLLRTPTATTHPNNSSVLRLIGRAFGKRRLHHRQSSTAKSTTATSSSVPEYRFYQSPLLWYGQRLETHPIVTKCVTSGMIAGSGDAFCQYIVYHNDKKDDEDARVGGGWWDAWRTGRFFLVGCFFVAPIVHVWYGMLLTRFPGISNVWKRLALDQLAFNPVFTPAFMGVLGLLEQQQQQYLHQSNKENEEPELWDRL
eukprot:scaffold225522_cov57-Attheya_sp.AAC.1